MGDQRRPSRRYLALIARNQETLDRLKREIPAFEHAIHSAESPSFAIWPDVARRARAAMEEHMARIEHYENQIRVARALMREQMNRRWVRMIGHNQRAEARALRRRERVERRRRGEGRSGVRLRPRAPARLRHFF